MNWHNRKGSKDKLKTTLNSLNGEGHIIFLYDFENLDDNVNIFDEILLNETTPIVLGIIPVF